ncbi:hypothetical protein L7F22_057325 [Adiantum nelumboides]|nr:hypothetical protein [Adiantum nelumboides]
MPPAISSFTLVRVSRNALCVRSSSAAVAEAPSAVEMPRLKSVYVNNVVPALKEEFQYTNVLQIPRVEKVVVNCGIGEGSQNAKILEAAIKDISTVTGQRPNITRAKKPIAGFKIREGVPVGIAVTLRGELMYSFLDRLLNLVLPRTRDFLGVSPYSFDGKGNYNLGLKEQGVFPEIRFDNIDKPRGMDIAIVTSARTDKEGQKLLTLLGMPFRQGDVSAKPVVKKKKGKFNIKGARGKVKKPAAKSKKKK